MFEQLPMYQNVGNSAYKKDLKNIILLCNYLNNPQNNFKSIHVGGTNGKGSTSHMISSVFQEAGYKVGLYTSPHIKDYRERIRISGEKISKDYVTEFISKNLDFFKKNNLSFFEMTVGLSFDYFSSKNVDMAIIEVGMGGRLDSTNIINPILSVITNISLDHTKFLGDTISSISREKAGIIKKNIPVVVGETQDKTKEIFKQIANEKKCKISFADQFDYDEYGCDLKGNYQKKNIKTCLNSLQHLQDQFKISQDNIVNGLNNVIKNTLLSGRWQVIEENPLTICDTAHNESALKEIVEQLLELDHEKLHFILGFSNDKDIEAIANIFPTNSEYYFVKPNVERSMESKLIMEIFSKSKRSGNNYKSVKDAFAKANNEADKEDIIFIGGSTFVVAEVL